MPRLICAIVLVLLITTPSLGQQSLVGTYKLISLVPEVDGKPFQPMGKAPHGYLVFTPTHFITIETAENRKFGTSVEAKAALLDSLVAYAGTYRIEGDKMFLTSEVVWVEGSGTDRTSVETFQLTGNRLTKTLGPRPFPRDPSKTLIRREVWEKIE
jgi:Lipocalin-like domain